MATALWIGTFQFIAIGASVSDLIDSVKLTEENLSWYLAHIGILVLTGDRYSGIM